MDCLEFKMLKFLLIGLILSASLFNNNVQCNIGGESLTLQENFLESLPGKDNTCVVMSHTLAIDKINSLEGTYDLLLTLATKEKDNCQLECSISSAVDKDSSKEIKINKKINISKRDYFTFEIQALKQYISYYYSCIDSSKNTTNSVLVNYYFIFPKSPATSQSTKLAVFGDWSKDDSGDLTYNYLVRNMDAKQYDSIVFLGDIAYDLESKSGDTGNDFLEFIKPITSNIPFMATPGNHEYKNKMKDFKKRFFLPLNQVTENLYYSYELNKAHFISINSEILFDKDGLFNKDYKKVFVEWLSHDLEISHLKKNKWNILYLHRPLYCSKLTNDKCDKEAKILREFLEDYFYSQATNEKKVDLILSGHFHTYERLLPIYKGEVDKNVLEHLNENKNNNQVEEYLNPKYPVYLICGAAGNSNGQAKSYDPAEFSRFVSNEIGFCEIEINNDSIMPKFVRSSDGKIIDEFKITKSEKMFEHLLRRLTTEDNNASVADSNNSNSATVNKDTNAPLQSNNNENKIDENPTNQASITDDKSSKNGDATKASVENPESNPQKSKENSVDNTTTVSTVQKNTDISKQEENNNKHESNKPPSAEKSVTNPENKSQQLSNANANNDEKSKTENIQENDMTGPKIEKDITQSTLNDKNKSDTKHSSSNSQTNEIQTNSLTNSNSSSVKPTQDTNTKNPQENKQDSKKNEVDSLPEAFKDKEKNKSTKIPINFESNKNEKISDDELNTNVNPSKDNNLTKDKTEDSTKKETLEGYQDEWKDEDSIARSAFGITICFVLVFIVVFIYNIIKCYTRSVPPEKPVDPTYYSRELQNQTLDEDTVLDLTTN